MWKFALKNLHRNRRRAIATGIAISAGFVGLVLLGDYVDRVKNILTSNTVYALHLGHISFYKKNALEKFFSKPTKFILNREEQKAIQTFLDAEGPEIEYVSHQLLGIGLLSQGDRATPFVAQGIEPEFDSFVNHHPFVKKWTPQFAKTDEQQTLSGALAQEPNAISVTESVAQINGIFDDLKKLPLDSPHRQVQLAGHDFYGDLNAVNAEIRLQHSTGMEFLEDTSIITSLKLLQGLYATDGLYTMAVYLKDASKTEEITTRLANKIKAANLPIEVYPFFDDKVGSLYTGTMSFLYVMSTFFIIIIVAAVSLSIANSLTMGIIERVREIGTLRALGYTPKMVTNLFVKEALILTALALAGGVGLAFVIIQVVNHLHIDFNPPTTSSAIELELGLNLPISLIVALCLIAVSYLTAKKVVSQKTKLKTIELLSDAGA